MIREWFLGQPRSSWICQEATGAVGLVGEFSNVALLPELALNEELVSPFGYKP